MLSTLPSTTPSTLSAVDHLWLLSGVEERSRDLVPRLRQRLVALCHDPAQHARFLNMLSLMEHIGSRKIMSSQTQGPLGCEVLKHLSEEARHAYFFKRQAERIAGRTLAYGPAETMAVAAAKMYFGRLDALVTQALPGEAAIETPYLYVSMIIELRAIWVYRLYHEVLIETGVPISLRSLLAEEELHLPQMAESLNALGEATDETVPAFAIGEDRLFRTLWQAVEEDRPPS